LIKIEYGGDPVSIVNRSFGKPCEIAGIKTYKGSYNAAGSSSGLATAFVFGCMQEKYAAQEAASI